MSRHNRERRKARAASPPWRCENCGMRFRSGADVKPVAHAALDAMTGGRPGILIHVCGGCRTLHVEERGKLRRMTPAEEFAARVQEPLLFDGFDDWQPPSDPSADAFLLFSPVRE